ncbi:Hypothetical predicted protein [Paramuricea clavata]|uniref:Uncharacterized protein n=1 Tax=Paramuricea clavata TaxID=317549 RepID=A0A7D9HEF8_PARCT|nr:Hypothetical predicted protein [Paramuricea clavata]
MHYEAAMTSPTELLAPDVFPDDITDMNGNAMCEKHTSKVDFHQKRSITRCLLWFLIFFIATTLVMAALFTWKMVESTNDSENSIGEKSQENKTCHKKAKPVRFKSIPKTIQDYLESWKEDIKTKMKETKQNVALVNVVYYDEVIWDAKFRWNDETKELKEEKVEKLFPVASLTKVITALLAYKLHNDGTIGLDDPIVKYEPDFWVRNPYKNDNGTEITIRELITFSSGLPREAPCYQDNAKNYCPHNTSYILQQLRKDTTRLLFPPGSDVLYGYVWRFIILIYFAESALLVGRGETQNDFNQGL